MEGSFWEPLLTLRKRLTQEDRVNKLQQQLQGAHVPDVDSSTENRFSKKNITSCIEAEITKILRDIAKHKAPRLTFDSRASWENVRFQEGVGLEMMPCTKQTSVKFDSILSVNKFALITKVLSIMYRLVQTGAYCTKRDLFYQDPQLFGNQGCLDTMVDDISCMLHIPRWHLHVVATSKGCVAGDLQYTEADGSYVDCTQAPSGVLVPSCVEGIKNLQTDARFVLVVEKDASFQMLLDSGICRKLGPCIMITGKGFPDVNTRLMVRKLWVEFHLPTLALVDADPHGFEILIMYKFGSRALSFEAPSLTVPTMRWLGILPSDIDRLRIPSTSKLPLSSADVDKAKEILTRPYIDQLPTWKKEIDVLLSSGVKAEIQCLASISPNFLTDVYLPNKIQYAGWL